MDNKKFFSKYKKLFKTNKAVDYFLEEYQDKLPLWQEILKYYWPKTGKPIGKINWKDLADRVFSEYVRLYYCDSCWVCVCITCWNKYKRNEIQAGHYRSRDCLKYRFDIAQVYPQCMRCNCILSGNYRNYKIFMDKTVWPEQEDIYWTDSELVELSQDRYEHNIMDWYLFNSSRKNDLKETWLW